MANPYFIAPPQSGVVSGIKTLGGLADIYQRGKQSAQQNKLAAQELEQRGRVSDQQHERGMRGLEIQEQGVQQAARRNELTEAGQAQTERQTPPHQQNFGLSKVYSLRGIFKQKGIELDNVMKPVTDHMEKLAKDPNVNNQTAYMDLKQNYPAYREQVMENIGKEMEKILSDDTPNTMQSDRIQKLQGLMQDFEQDREGKIVDAVFGPTRRALEMESMAQEAAMAKAMPEQFTLSPGQARFDAAGNIIAQGPAKEISTPSELNEFETIQYGKNVPEIRGTPIYQENYLDFLKRKQIATTTPNRTEPTVLRKEYIKQSEPYVKVRDAWQRIQKSAENPSAAGDLAMIFNYMKVLDPGSVVRESEYATAAQTGAFGERVKAAFNRVKSGEKLSDAMRNDFVNRAERLYEGQKEGHQKLIDEYTRLSDELGVEPSNVLIDYDLEEKKIKNEEFDVGEIYEGADGTRKRYAGKDDKGNHLWEDVQ